MFYALQALLIFSKTSTITLLLLIMYVTPNNCITITEANALMFNILLLKRNCTLND